MALPRLLLGLLAALLLVSLAACGNIGPLYLPDDPHPPVYVPPKPAPEASSAPAPVVAGSMSLPARGGHVDL